MSSHESRKKNTENRYKGTIIPEVAVLINQCIGKGCVYRVLVEGDPEILNPEKQPTRQTIVVNNDGKLVTSFWG